jgi:hypothetical protein
VETTNAIFSKIRPIKNGYIISRNFIEDKNKLSQQKWREYYEEMHGTNKNGRGNG